MGGDGDLPEIRLLGGFELRHAGRAVEVPASAQRLVAFLALNKRPQSRSFIAGTLWPETTDARAAANLRTVLWRLHDLPTDPVCASAATVALAHDVEVDVHQLEAVAELLRTGVDDLDIRQLDPATFVGKLLPGLWDSWLVFERERLRQIGLHALEILSRRLSAAGEHDLAIIAGLAAVEADPLRETANRVLVEAHLAEGNRVEAVRHFARFRERLHDELGLAPSASLQAQIDMPSERPRRDVPMSYG